MSIPLVNSCLKPPTFDEYYQLRKVSNVKVCDKTLAGQLYSATGEIKQTGGSRAGVEYTAKLEKGKPSCGCHSQSGGGAGLQYTATGDLVNNGFGSNCGCQKGGSADSESEHCPHSDVNQSSVVPGPMLNLSESVGNRPVISTQNVNYDPTENMLDKQFDCLQSKWCKNCE